MLLQVGIGLREVVIAKEAAMCREWRRMWRGEHQMLHPVDHCALFNGIGAPQDKHHMLTMSRESRYGSIGELFPAMPLMRTRTVRLNSERSIEQQHTLARPAAQVTAGGNGPAIAR